MSNETLQTNARRIQFLAEVTERLNNFELSLAASGVTDAPARRARVEYQLKALTAGFDDYELEQSLSLLSELMQAVRTDAEVESLSEKWGLRGNRIEELHTKYDAVVWDAIWKTLRDDAGQLPFYRNEVARDLHGTCWLKIVEKLGKYRDTGKISGWIWTVCQNTVLDWKRSSARRWSAFPEEQLSAVVKGSPRPRVSRLITPSRIGLRLRRAALCPVCGDSEPRKIVTSTRTHLTLSCGHSRPRGL